MADAPEKRQVRLQIFNQSYTLLVSSDPADLEDAARLVDDLMIRIAKAGNHDTTRVAVLAALHLADQLRSLERRLDDKTRRLTGLLDQIIAG